MELEYDIQDVGGYFVLWQNRDAKPVDIMGFRNIKIEWGEDDGKIKIRRVFYPKDAYTKEEITHIWGGIKGCPYCEVGYSLKKSKEEEIHLLPLKEKGKNRIINGDKNMVELTGIFDRITKNEEASKLYGGALIAGLTQIPIDLCFTALGSKLIKGIVAIGTGLASWKIAGGRLADELMVISAMYTSSLFDPSPEKIEQLKREIEMLKGAAQFGDSKGIMNAIVRTDIFNVITDMVKGVEFKLPKELQDIGKIAKDVAKAPQVEFF